MSESELQSQQAYWNRWAGDFDAWNATADPAAAVAFLTGHTARGDKLLELGVGTGRVALPLCRQGRHVSGLDISDDLLAQLERKRQPGDTIKTIHGDMASFELAESFACIYVIYSSLFGVLSQSRQADVFRRVASHLEPDGIFVVETYNAIPRLLTPSKQWTIRNVGPGGVSVSAVQINPVEQRSFYQELTWAANGELSILPVETRYCTAAEMDLMAEMAGLRLVGRSGDYDGSPFTAQSVLQVSIYETADIDRKGAEGAS